MATPADTAAASGTIATAVANASTPTSKKDAASADTGENKQNDMLHTPQRFTSLLPVYLCATSEKKTGARIHAKLARRLKLKYQILPGGEKTATASDTSTIRLDFSSRLKLIQSNEETAEASALHNNARIDDLNGMDMLWQACGCVISRSVHGDSTLIFDCPAYSSSSTIGVEACPWSDGMQLFLAALLLYGGHAGNFDELMTLMPIDTVQDSGRCLAVQHALSAFRRQKYKSAPLDKWLSTIYPLGPGIHDVIRTKNGINFADAARASLNLTFDRLAGGSSSLPLRICQGSPDGFDGLGAVVWQCGIALAHFLAEHHNLDDLISARGNDRKFSECRVLDLGCGTGLVGLVAAACKAKNVVLSDRQEIVAYARANIELNREQLGKEAANAVGIHEYEWCEETTKQENGNENSCSSIDPCDRNENDFDLIICSDCFYDASSFPGLFATIERIAVDTKRRACFLFGYKLRHAAREATFLKRLHSELGAHLRVFGQAAVAPRSLRGIGIHIVHVSFQDYQLTDRPESTE